MNNINKKTVSLKFFSVLLVMVGFSRIAMAEDLSHASSHLMQHGFVLGAEDRFASHLVAEGHHSRQVEITGQLVILDSVERKNYEDRKNQSGGASYFLLQAQGLDLPVLAAGGELKGHIIESKLGDYEPKNTIVKSAIFKVEKVLLNIPNPFFVEPK